MEGKEGGSGYEWKNIRVGTSPEGKPYFERRKVKIPDPTKPPEEPRAEGLLTKEELEKRRAEKMARDWDRATSKKGRPPIGGAVDD